MAIETEKHARIPTVGRRFDIGAASRHSGRVRMTRRAIVVGVPALLVSIALMVVFQPFHFKIALNLGKVRIAGTRIDVVAPRLSGYRADGTPYAVKASLGRQDLATPSRVEMQDVDADFVMGDGTSANVTASTVTYDSSADSLRLAGAVHMRNGGGYAIQTSSALVDFKTGDVAAEAGVHVALTDGDITADTMTVVDDGHRISFGGSVHSTFRSQRAAVAEGDRP